MKKILLLFLLSCSSIYAYAGVGFYNQTGTDALLNCGSAGNILSGSNAETFNAWIYSTTDTSNGSTPRVAAKYMSGSSTPGGSELDLASTNALTFIISTSSTSMTVTSSNSTLSFNANHMITIVTDGSLTAANTTLYVDGTVVSGYQTQTNGSGTADSGGLVYLGNRGNAARPMVGAIFEAEDWNTQLTAAQITQAYNSGKQGYNMRNIAPANLQSWWRLNGCAAGQVCTNTFTDEMGNNNCTTSNSPIGEQPPYDYQVDAVMKDAKIK